jgi:hypothetical protein
MNAAIRESYPAGTLSPRKHEPPKLGAHCRGPCSGQGKPQGTAVLLLVERVTSLSQCSEHQSFEGACALPAEFVMPK